MADAQLGTYSRPTPERTSRSRTNTCERQTRTLRTVTLEVRNVKDPRVATAHALRLDACQTGRHSDDAYTRSVEAVTAALGVMTSQVVQPGDGC
jgi:hypothetical protein